MTVHLVGAGPGNPDVLTVRGAHLIVIGAVVGLDLRPGPATSFA